MWINADPNENGISQVYSPREIITGKMLEYDLHFKAKVGQYVHTHIEQDKTKRIQIPTFLGMYLGPTGNIRTGYGHSA